MISCSNCGKEISEDVAHCGHCGHRVQLKQKKTMVGLGAIDKDALQAKLEKNKQAAKADAATGVSQASTSAGEASEEADADLAATTLMDEVDLPMADTDAASDEHGELVTAATEKMEKVVAPVPGAGDSLASESAAESDSDATSDLLGSEEPELVGGTQDRAPVDTESMEPLFDDEGSRADGSDQDDAMAASMTSNPEDDPLVEPSAPEDSEQPKEEEPAADEPTTPQNGEASKPGDEPLSQQDDGPSANKPGRNLMEMSADDAASPFDTVGDQESKSRRRMLMFVGILVVLIMGCCVATTVSWYTMGGMG